MMSHYRLTLLTWRKLTKAEQSFYLAGYLKHLDVDTEPPKPIDEMFRPSTG